MKATHTPIRSVRVDDDTWAELDANVKAAGSDRSAVILCMIEELNERCRTGDPAEIVRAIVEGRDADQPVSA